jgi:hypothetical protein
MADRLPLLSAQLAFGLEAERVGRRATVTLMFRMPPSRISVAKLGQILQSILLRNPALSYRIRFSRGAAYQEWHPAECDFAELYAASTAAVPGRALELLEEFDTALEGAAMSARLIRSPEGDDLLLVFDHALVDEQSLLIIKRQLDSLSCPDGREQARYEAAVNDRKACETVAADGLGIKFWADRLAPEIGGSSMARNQASRLVPVVGFPGVVIPSDFRGSLFPYVLFSAHRALRDFGESGPTIIGYPWGGRNPAFSDVVGCFMNTVISYDRSGAQQAPEALRDFLGRWYQEIDHADVPLSAVTALGTTFPGSVTAFLSYTRALARVVKVAGTEAVEVPFQYARTHTTSAVMAGATARDDELQLRLFLDEEAVGYGAKELGTRWCHWLSRAIHGFPERKP